jgi:hypothetical protein
VYQPARRTARTLAAAATAAAVALTLGTAAPALAAPALAGPGPGGSNQCAPGQHAGPTPPGSCDNK